MGNFTADRPDGYTTRRFVDSFRWFSVS